MKHLPLPLPAILIFFFPLMGFAQPFPPRPVALMPFAGDTANGQLCSSISAEIPVLPGNFHPVLETLPTGLSAKDLPSDEPPPIYMIEGFQYVVTGASYPEFDGNHLQIWLWDVLEPSLIYTDEMVYGEIDDAGEFVGFLVNWVFSHVPDPEKEEEPALILPVLAEAAPEVELPVFQEQAVAEIAATQEQAVPELVTPQKEETLNRWFYLGLRLGGSLRQYTIPNFTASAFYNTSAQSRMSPSLEFALHGTFQMLSFLALQAEAMFTMDFAAFPAFSFANSPQGGSMVVESTIYWRYMSLMFPILLKFTFRPNKHLLAAPYGGVYIIPPMDGPLGLMEITSPWDAYPSQTLRYQRDQLLAWTAGLTLSVELSQSRKGITRRFLMDIRASSDVVGLTSVKQTPGYASSFVQPFRRDMITVSFGWEIGMGARRK